MLALAVGEDLQDVPEDTGAIKYERLATASEITETMARAGS
jgi:hypothetical protein